MSPSSTSPRAVSSDGQYSDRSSDKLLRNSTIPCAGITIWMGEREGEEEEREREREEGERMVICLEGYPP